MVKEVVIKFGTDGWRGRIGDDYTFDNVRRCADGFARYLSEKGLASKGVIIGYDKRFQSEYFAAACAEVLAAHGIQVWLTQGATPTPVISYSVVDKQAGGAINITASHNPPVDNGFKVRDPNGAAIDPEGLKQIESNIPSIDDVKSLSIEQAKAKGLVQEFDPAPAYLEHLKDLIDVQPIIDAGLTVLVEPMWGNGAGWFTNILSGGKTRVIEIHNERNPIFPEMSRPEPIQPNIDVGLRKTVEYKADVCLITDGDADRMGVGDENGVFLNQLQVYSLLALYYLEVRKELGPIVKTLSTTSMLDKLGKLYNVPVYETGVGFKYIAPKFMEVDAILGGEESGGYAFRGNVPERDGILGNLYFLDFMVKTGKKPSELLQYLFSKVGAHYYTRVDTRMKEEEREAVEQRVKNADPKTVGGLKVTGINKTDGFKFEMEDGGWLLIRLSGTEPLVRVYSETTHEDRLDAIIEDGLKIAGLK